MNRPVDGLKGRISLVLCNCAGMIDIVALPVWVGIVLIGQYGLDPQRAGALATFFLGAVVASSLFFSPRIDRIRSTIAVPAGFGVAAAAFFALAATRDYGTMAALHIIGGLAVGCGMSFTHSVIGSSANPHRLMAIAFTALSLVSFGFLSSVPQLVISKGGGMMFVVLGSIMLVAALFAMPGFPVRQAGLSRNGKPVMHAPLSRGVWFAMIGTILLTMSHSMMSSFLEPMGLAHGFSKQQILAVFVAIGVVNLFPGLLAAFFERKVAAGAVMIGGPALQGILALVLTQSPTFALFALAASAFPAVLIFTHTFVFGFLARNDPSTRAVAATSVVAMTGSAIGPSLGGLVAHNLGYASIGWSVAVVASVGVFCFWQAQRGAPRTIPAATAVL